MELFESVETSERRGPHASRPSPAENVAFLHSKENVHPHRTYASTQLHGRLGSWHAPRGSVSGEVDLAFFAARDDPRRREVTFFG